ncbi:MAG: ABC transporter permease [Clostridia bacterium]|nr:ABC transporter permease [Clostridia bacterium]
MKIKVAFQNMFRKPLRCILIILSVAIGVSSVISIMKASEIAQNYLESELNALGMDGITISCTANSENAFLNSEDLEMLENSDAVVYASPTIVEFGTISVDENPDSALIWGIGNDCESVLNIKMLAGSEIGVGEIDEKSKSCLVSREVACKYFGNAENAVGKTITLTLKKNTDSYTVTGVMEHTSGILENVAGEFIPEIIYIPYTTMQKCLKSEKISQISLKLKDTKHLEEDAEILVNKLNAAKGANYVKYTNLTDQRQNFNHILEYASVILFIIGSITLLVAGIAVMTTMFSSIHERKRELGIKKAIGATFSDILYEFLLEAIVITFIGSLVGIAFTAYAFTVLNLAFGLKLMIDMRLFVYAILLSVSIGCVFGVTPAISAAKQNPIQCLSA